MVRCLIWALCCDKICLRAFFPPPLFLPVTLMHRLSSSIFLSFSVYRFFLSLVFFFFFFTLSVVPAHLSPKARQDWERRSESEKKKKKKKRSAEVVSAERRRWHSKGRVNNWNSLQRKVSRFDGWAVSIQWGRDTMPSNFTSCWGGPSSMRW